MLKPAQLAITGLLCMTPTSSPLDLEAFPHGATSLVITAGGTYSGHWVSEDPDIPAVTIRTSEPVTLENCVVSGVGTLISTRYGKPEATDDGVNPKNTDGADLTVRNCTAKGYRPELRDRAPPRFLVVRNPWRVNVQHNMIEGTRGMWIYADPARPPPVEITIRFNSARNLDGRCWDACSMQNIGAWIDHSGVAVANFVQLADIREAHAVDITWNDVRNEPGNSAVEDLINLFRVRGTEDQPINVSNNLLIGAFPGRDPLSGYYSGAAIVVDGLDTDETTGPAWIRIFANSILYASNAAIGIAAGYNNTVFENIVINSGKYKDGFDIKTETVGIYVWNCCNADENVFRNNVAHSNSSYVRSYRDGEYIPNEYWFPDCAVDANDQALCLDNERLTQVSAREVEARLVSRWERAREARLEQFR